VGEWADLEAAEPEWWERRQGLDDYPAEEAARRAEKRPQRRGRERGAG
jgi:hypothetical protein